MTVSRRTIWLKLSSNSRAETLKLINSRQLPIVARLTVRLLYPSTHIMLAESRITLAIQLTRSILFADATGLQP
jgi:hypothetical protein